MGECVDMQGKKSGIPVMIWQKRLEFQTKKGITKAGIPTPSIGGGPLFSGIAHFSQPPPILTPMTLLDNSNRC